MNLYPYEWAQVRAALRLWCSVAESSEVHPVEVRGVRDALGPHEPMALEEIESLIALDGSEIPDLENITQACERLAWLRPGRLRRAVDELGILPYVGTSGLKTAWYRQADLQKAIRYLGNR